MIKKHRDNLLKLANYLDKLDPEYAEKHFNMRYFYAHSTTWGSKQNIDPDEDRKPLNTCGTCACAVGHGPSAGIRIYGDTSWFSYCDRVFGVRGHSAAWFYLFVVYNESNPYKVAKRIRNYVETGATQDAD